MEIGPGNDLPHDSFACHTSLNERKFWTLLRFGIDAGDIELENRLKTIPKSAVFISKTVLNGLIIVVGI